MGRIVVATIIENGTDPSCRIVCEALVDTGAAYLTLPNAWRPGLGQLATYATVDVETASQAVVTGAISGPILLRFASFRQVLAEVLFIDMEPADGRAMRRCSATFRLSRHRPSSISLCTVLPRLIA